MPGSTITMTKYQVPLVLFVALAILNQYGIGAPTAGLTTEELTDILKKIDKNEWGAFLRKQFELGYNIQELKQAWTNKSEADLAVQIFNYLVQNQQVVFNRNQNAKYKEQICFPEPIGCFDPNDAPVRPQ